MDRRAFLAASTVTASGLAVRAAAATNEGPFGATAIPVPVSPAQQLPLGPLPSTRYPDNHVESLDKRFKGSVGTGAVELSKDDASGVLEQRRVVLKYASRAA